MTWLWGTNLRLSSSLLIVTSLTTAGLAAAAAGEARAGLCPQNLWVAAVLVAIASSAKLLWFIGAGIAQAAAAASVIDERVGGAAEEDRRRSSTMRRRKKYHQWILWLRAGYFLAACQTAFSTLLSYQIAARIHDSLLSSSGCMATDALRTESSPIEPLLLAACVFSWVIAIAPLVLGVDVLNWRNLYEMEERMWRAHYREIFDQHIREVLCCLGRSQYWRSNDEDEVNTVAALLGDLLAYRAKGASHLDVLAGMALLRADGKRGPPPHEHLPKPPMTLLQEAAALQPFAVAAYTGPLLDFGRNPCTWICAWIYRQGVLHPWKRNKWPVLEGDNILRGHAAAFLRYMRLRPECLRKGRVQQKHHWEAVYFVTVLHEDRSVVVAVRGTETVEDVITDALGRAWPLSEADLGGLHRMESSQDVSQAGPCKHGHFAHRGVIIAARELAYELDRVPMEQEEPTSPGPAGDLLPGRGLLSSLLAPGGECEGYALRFVGHSLGGGIATVTALRLRPRFPQLHVFAFNTIPSLDKRTAELCSEFVTSIVYNHDFASHLSVASVLRLRSAALQAATPQGSTPSDLTNGLGRAWSTSEISLLHDPPNPEHSSPPLDLESGLSPPNLDSRSSEVDFEARESGLVSRGSGFRSKRPAPLTLEQRQGGKEGGSVPGEGVDGMGRRKGGLLGNGSEGELRRRLEENYVKDPAELASRSSRTVQAWDLADEGGPPVELFVPGMVVHVVRVDKGGPWIPSRFAQWQHEAVITDRRNLREIPISNSMFLDHMPWRLQSALNDLIEKAHVKELLTRRENGGNLNLV